MSNGPSPKFGSAPFTGSCEFLSRVTKIMTKVRDGRIVTIYLYTKENIINGIDHGLFIINGSPVEIAAHGRAMNMNTAWEDFANSNGATELPIPIT